MKKAVLFMKACPFLVTLFFFCNSELLSQNITNNKKQEFGLEKATNLGSPVNSSSVEYAPTISADGKTLIFESDKMERFKWDLFITKKTTDGWSYPIPLNEVNSKIKNDFDGSPFLTYDNNYLIFTSDRSGGIGKTDIWISQRLGENWSKPENIGAPVNSSGYDGFASMSSDGKTLYFMRDADDKGECNKNYDFDLYFSEKQNEKWMEPQKLPFPINTKYCEKYPTILVDGKTLIFSSIRPGGFGDYDLYKSVRQDDGSWSEPINLGSFINTEKEDALVSLPASGNIMYFASGESNVQDIYSIPIPLAVQPTKVVTVSGTVRDAKNNKSLSAKITILDVENTSDTTFINSNKTDGSYIVILNKGKLYDVSVSAPGYTFLSTQFDLKELVEYHEYNRDILLEPIETGSKIVLNNIYFGVDSDSLLFVSRFELDRAIKLMNDNPEMIVEISGHTDNTASDQYNLDLSLRRAKSVVRYFVSNGIGNNRLNAKGYGESQPVAANDTEEGREKNRRVEFKIMQVKAGE